MKFVLASLLIMMSLSANKAYAQLGSVKIELTSMKTAGTACRLFWNITNRTGLNITTITFSPSLQEVDGSTINSMIFQTARLKNEEEVNHGSLGMDAPCEKIKTVKFGAVSLLFVDGSSRRDLMSRIGDSLTFSSKINSVKVIP